MLSQTKKGEDKKEKPPIGSIFGLIGCKKGTETGKRGQDAIDQSIDPLLFQTKREKTGKKGHQLQCIDPSQNKEKGKGKGIQEEVNCPAALPNKKGKNLQFKNHVVAAHSFLMM